MALTEEREASLVRTRIESYGVSHGATLAVPTTREIARVCAWPGEIEVVILADDNVLDVEQAQQLVDLLKAAIDQAPRLSTDEDGVLQEVNL